MTKGADASHADACRWSARGQWSLACVRATHLHHFLTNTYLQSKRFGPLSICLRSQPLAHGSTGAA